MSTVSDQDSILSSAITLQRTTLWFGAMELYESRLSITGWSWTGKVNHTLPLDAIRLVEVWPDVPGVNLAIYPEEGHALFCRCAEDVLLWANVFQAEDRMSLEMQPDHYPSYSEGILSRPSLV